MKQLAAKDRYFAQDEPLAVALNALSDIAYPGQRADLLTKVYEARLIQARVYTDAFGEDHDETDGMDLAVSVRFEALLYLLLADVERAVALSAPRRVFATELEGVAGEVLDQMATEPDLHARSRLLEPLHAAVADTVGGQAVEALWCLQSPGMVGWMTLDERDDWNAGHGYGSATAANQFSSIATTLLGIAVAVAATGLLVWTFIAAGNGNWLGAVIGAALNVTLPVWYVRRVFRHRAILEDTFDDETSALPEPDQN